MVRFLNRKMVTVETGKSGRYFVKVKISVKSVIARLWAGWISFLNDGLVVRVLVGTWGRCCVIFW